MRVLTDTKSGRFLEYALDRPDIRPVWQKFTEHEFVLGMGSGTLPVERFKEYLVQDYLYLVGPIYPSFVPWTSSNNMIFRSSSLEAMRLRPTRLRIWNPLLQ